MGTTEKEKRIFVGFKTQRSPTNSRWIGRALVKARRALVTKRGSSRSCVEDWLVVLAETGVLLQKWVPGASLRFLAGFPVTFL